MDQDGLVVTHLVDAMIEIHIIGIIGEDRAPPMVGGVTIMTPMEDTGIVLCLPGVGAIPELIDFIVFIFFSCFCQSINISVVFGTKKKFEKLDIIMGRKLRRFL